MLIGMCINIYVHMCICACMYVCGGVYVCIDTYTYRYTHSYAYIVKLRKLMKVKVQHCCGKHLVVVGGGIIEHKNSRKQEILTNDSHLHHMT